MGFLELAMPKGISVLRNRKNAIPGTPQERSSHYAPPPLAPEIDESIVQISRAAGEIISTTWTSRDASGQLVQRTTGRVPVEIEIIRLDSVRQLGADTKTLPPKPRGRLAGIKSALARGRENYLKEMGYDNP
jgi:hypothetical protein